jgi:2,3-bisphosphoglycerate-independent phosphoglycerate mutase
MKKKTHLLLILDGWGLREDADDNAISQANTPTYDALLAKYPNTAVATSGLEVGLPEGQMGNSEVGHMNIGAGRVVYQDFTKVTQAIATGDFSKNQALTQAIDTAVTANKSVHIMGLLSPGGVHSHDDHIFAAIKLAAERGARQIYLHGFLDGRDTPPKSALGSIHKAEVCFEALGVGGLATLVGRYYAMDRDNRWDRVEQAYDLLVHGKGQTFVSAEAALEAAYAADKSDEFMPASVIIPEATIAKGDAVLFMNFRADRARELTKAFTEVDFNGFSRARIDLNFVALTEYESEMSAAVAYPSEDITQSLGEIIASVGMTQLRIAETEKYAHVTFFFNGGSEQPFAGEDRELVQSPDVATYDLQPQMNAPEVTSKLVAAIDSGKYDLIVCNLANPDMVGHTGVMTAAIKAVEAIDEALVHLSQAILQNDGVMLVTADHGNIEMMRDEESGQAHTAHTTNLVPLLYVANDAMHVELVQNGALCDLAPTLLTIMGIEVPAAMTGKSLV